MNFFYDFLIFAFLIVDVALIITLVHQELHLARERGPRVVRGVAVGAILLVVVVAGGLVTYGSFIEPRRITVRYEPLVLKSEGEHRMRIALLADLHAGPYLSERFVERVIDRVLRESPDFVLFAGDFMSNRGGEGRETLAPLGRVVCAPACEAPHGAYAVLGNHDYLAGFEIVEEVLATHQVKLLKNEYALLGEEEARLAIVGADDLWFGALDLDAAVAGIPEGVPRLLLTHNPDIVYALGDHRFDAILAAHTHGGQIRLPGVGAIAPIPTVLGKEYDRGVFSWAGMPLVITQGIGVIGPRARLFAPPEIMILDVTY